MSDFLRPHGLQYARPPCPSPTPGVYSNSCPLSWWCHPTISSSAIPSSSCLQLGSFPASGSFPVSQFFAWGGQSIRVSASTSVLPINIQDWFPLGWTGWIYIYVYMYTNIHINIQHLFFLFSFFKINQTWEEAKISFLLCKSKKKKWNRRFLFCTQR